MRWCGFNDFCGMTPLILLLIMRDWVVMNQTITFHKPNKKVVSEKMKDPFSQTKSVAHSGNLYFVSSHGNAGIWMGNSVTCSCLCKFGKLHQLGGCTTIPWCICAECGGFSFFWYLHFSHLWNRCFQHLSWFTFWKDYVTKCFVSAKLRIHSGA